MLSKYLARRTYKIENEKGYLIKGVINQAINVKNRKKELKRGEVWLPEPIATEETDMHLYLRDIASYSLLILLEALTPKERAVFILKEGFAYSHKEIAKVISSTVEGSRKLLDRAKGKIKRLQQEEIVSDRETVPPGLIEKYLSAVTERDIKTLEHLLARDISIVADGGDKIQVVSKFCSGQKEVIDLLIFVYHKFNVSSSIIHCKINHQPALLYFEENELQACQIFDISATHKIRRISTILVPRKLTNIQLL